MLLRFDPFRDLDRVTEQMLNRPVLSAVPMDAVRRGDAVVISFDLPGVDPGSIDLTVERDVLTVQAERRPVRDEGDEVLAGERRHGSFSRRVLLGDTLDTDKVKADYDHGVLTVVIPTAEVAKARKVEVGGAGSDKRAIDAAGAETKASSAA
jgi:HSP20 family protein